MTSHLSNKVTPIEITNLFSKNCSSVGFYGISILVGYLIANPVHTYTGCLNVHRTAVTTNNSANNNVVLFLFDLKIVYNHHHVAPPARISLTLFRHFSLSFIASGRSSVAVCKFVLVVLLLHIHMWGSTGVHRLWARPCFSSSVPRVLFV